MCNNLCDKIQIVGRISKIMMEDAQMQYRNFLMLLSLITVFLFISSEGTVNAGSGPNEGCSVIINKSANPADNTAFTFHSNFIGEFELRDPSNNSASYPIGVGQIEEVVETVPENWNLVDVKCESIGVNGDFIDNGVAFECLTIGGSISCTFFNEAPETAPAQVPALSESGVVVIVAMMLIIGVYAVYRSRKAA